MKLNKITKVVLYFILLIILLYLVPAVVLRLQRKAPYIDGYTDAITRVRGESGADSIIMDFSKCSRGNNLGSRLH